MRQTVAFIGLGNMGHGMATNLVKTGFTVQAFDLIPENMHRAINAGCLAAGSAVAAVKGADYVVTMLPNGEIVEKLYIDDEALLNHISTSTLVIDCSTIAPENARRVTAEAKTRGIQSIEAPVSGGIAAAAAGTLAFMCGGEPGSFEAAKPILEAMGRNCFHVGESGSGQLAKLCNNMLLAIHMIGTAEAIQLGVDNGLDPKVLSDIMCKSSGCNWTLEKYNPYPGVMENVPASNGYQGGFMVNLMKKDLSLAMEAAQRSDSNTPMGALAKNLFGLHSQSDKVDKGSLDFSSIQQLYGK